MIEPEDFNVALVLLASGEVVERVARQLGIGHGDLREWAKKDPALLTAYTAALRAGKNARRRHMPADPVIHDDGDARLQAFMRARYDPARHEVPASTRLPRYRPALNNAGLHGSSMENA